MDIITYQLAKKKSKEFKNYIPYNEIPKNIIENCIPLECKEIYIKGDAYQYKTNGYQLLNLPNKKNIGEITVEYGNAFVKVDGIAPTNYYNITPMMQEVFEVGTYTFSAPSTKPMTITFRGWDEDLKSYSWQINPNRSSSTITIEKPITQYRIIIATEKGAEYNFTFYPMFEKGSVAHPPETYTGKIPSPNPEYPQKINIVKKIEIIHTDNQTKKEEKELCLKNEYLNEDTLNLVTGKGIKKWGKYTITGDEKWKFSNDNYVFLTSDTGNYNYKQYKDGGRGLCEQYEHKLAGDKTFHIGNGSFLCIEDHNFTNLNEYIQYFKKLYNEGNPLVIYYLLDKEEEVQDIQTNFKNYAGTNKYTITDSQCESTMPEIEISAYIDWKTL